MITLWEGLDNMYRAMHKAGVSRETYLLFREVIQQLTCEQIQAAINLAEARHQLEQEVE